MASLDGNLSNAEKCPKCQSKGELVAVTPAPPNTGPRGSKVHTMACTNDLCPDQGERWIYQIHPDGTIPLRAPRGHKQFEIDQSALAYGKIVVEQERHRMIKSGEMDGEES
jgi:hypothetical protein